jgi:hypothetical protein
MQAPPSWHARRTRSRVLALAVAAATVLTLLLTTDPPHAGAAVPAAGISITPPGYGAVRLGPMAGPAGSTEHGYCVQAWAPPSGSADAARATSTPQDPALAAVLARHRFATDDTTQAAIGYLVHQRHERPGPMAGGDVAAVHRLLDEATPAAVRARAAALLASGEREAGPFTGDPGTVTGQGRRTGVIRGIALVSAAGERITGVPYTVTLSGPAVLDATGTRTFSGTTGSDPAELAWTATASGRVSYRVEFPEVWRTTITVVEIGGNRQDQLTYGNRPEHDGHRVVVPGPEFPVVGDFRPRATTTVQDVRVTDGDPLVDLVTFAAAPGDAWAVVDGEPVPVPADVTWYGPFPRPQPQAPLPPADAPVAGVDRVVAHGPGTVATPGEVRASGPGFYTAVVTIRRADAGPFAEYVREDFRAPYFEEVETAVSRFRLVHESEAREFNVVPGGRAFDRITIRGYPDDHGEFGGLGGWGADEPEAVVTVYGPLPELPRAPEVPADAPVHWTGTVPAVNGVVEVGYDPDDPVLAPTTPTFPGGDYFVFVYAFAGDDRVEPFVSRFDDLREAFFVPGPAATPPVVVTQAQERVPAGGTMADTALVMGSTAEGDHLVFEAFGPQDPAAEPVCDASTLLWTSAAVPVSGPGYYASGPAPAPDAPGHVYWVETLFGADGTQRHRGPCGIPSETTLVVAEPVVTAPEPETPAAPEPAHEPVEEPAAPASPLPVTGAGGALAGVVGAVLLAGGVTLTAYRARVRRVLDDAEPVDPAA